MEELIEKFTQAVKKYYESSLVGDWRTTNREARTIHKTVKKFWSLGEPGMEALLSLTDSEDLSVSLTAAVYSLKYATEKCIAVLNRIAKEPGLLGFGAEQALQRWYEGEWKLDE